MSSEDLDALVARAQAGDVRAFEVLVSEQLARVRRLARAFARTEGDADDLAQEALLRVYRNLRSFRWQSSFTTWLFAVVRSACLDARKGRERTRRDREEPLADVHAEREGGPRPDEALDAAQERERVWAALRELPVEYRTALALFDVEGLSYDEVAAVEGVAVGTVKSRLHRGRAALRELLARPEDTGPAAVASAGTSASVLPSNPSRKP